MPEGDKHGTTGKRAALPRIPARAVSVTVGLHAPKSLARLQMYNLFEVTTTVS